MVPSASALLVLLVAVSTGRLVLGLALIVAFGIGMAAVLGGLAVAAIWLRAAVLRGRGLVHHPLLNRLAGWLPLASGTAVTLTGVVLALSAVARLA
jgi:ABC-type nickel/cobalt efflux system permease component RcnA